MTGFVRAMLDHAEPLSIVDGDLVDTCGTGGDRAASINVSTIAALVVAGAGARVCKHGGRAASSAAGSADVLEALGVAIDLGPGGRGAVHRRGGDRVLFRAAVPPGDALRHPGAARARGATVFNFLGPLANPAGRAGRWSGWATRPWPPKMLGVLEANGSMRAMVVYGDDGLDELSTTGPSHGAGDRWEHRGGRAAFHRGPACARPRPGDARRSPRWRRRVQRHGGAAGAGR